MKICIKLNTQTDNADLEYTFFLFLVCSKWNLRCVFRTGHIEFLQSCNHIIQQYSQIALLLERPRARKR